MYAYLIAAVVAAAMFAGTAYKAYQLGADGVRAEYAARDLKASQDYAAKEREITEAYRAKEAKLAQQVAAVSKDYQRKVANAHTQRLADLAAIDARTLRLRDPGTDSQACGSTAATPSATASGRDDRSGAYLSDKAARFLLGLATEADSVVTQLSACQQILIDERK